MSLLPLRRAGLLALAMSALAPSAALAIEPPELDSFAEGIVVLDGQYGCRSGVDELPDGTSNCPDGPGPER